MAGWQKVILWIAGILAAVIVLASNIGPTTNIAATSPATAQARAEPTLAYDKPSRGNTHWELMVTLVAPATGRGFDRVGMSCAFLLGQRPIDSQGQLVTNLKPGQLAHVKVLGPQVEKLVDNASCRVDYAYTEGINS